MNVSYYGSISEPKIKDDYTYLYKHLPSKENRYYLSRVVAIKNYY